MLELVAGVLVTLAAVAIVLEPLLFRRSAEASPLADLDVVEIEESASPKLQALLALQEIEFDHATGKLSDADFERMKSDYAKRALAAIKHERAEDGSDGSSIEDEAERIIRAAKGDSGKRCPTCGPRPEADAVFCSQCGRALSMSDARPRCPSCGTEIGEGSEFCSGCGGAVGELELEALHLS